ncbi:MAG: hypothetical protein WDO71_08790 [Bacteroidota bacterium]
MCVHQEIPQLEAISWGDRGVLSVWVLHEAWLFSMETIEKLFKEKKITEIKKRRLESKYASFYQKSRPKNLKTADDILRLEENARKMMLMLADLGVDEYKLLYKQF